MLKYVFVPKRVIIYLAALMIAVGQPVAAFATTEDLATEYEQLPPLAQVDVAPAENTDQTSPVVDDSITENAAISNQPTTEVLSTQNPAPLTIIEPAPVDSSAESMVADRSSSNTAQTEVTVIHGMSSDAQSGDALIDSNTTVGSASSGDAEAIATVLNNINSSMSLGENQKVASFSKDIIGDVKGDIILYPMLLKSMLESQAGNPPLQTINSTTDFDVENQIDLHAQSGDATVTRNTQAGDATTGTASAVANVVNILNSMIATQQSFIGTINIYGNLEGDILLAPDFIPQMLASNADAKIGSSSDTSASVVSTANTTTIVNDISAIAESGAAEVLNNTSSGGAFSGDALSNVVIFNLSGHDIIAKNSLLVFVNVLGKWVGVIVDAPTGATAALIGNGVSNHSYVPDMTVLAETNHSITNTISVVAQSGDAEVSYNTVAGSAVSGQARAMANIANVSSSQFGLTDWFGVLFINVFQNWHGSFGVNTAYGDDPSEAPAPSQGPIAFVPTETKPPIVTAVAQRTSFTVGAFSSGTGPVGLSEEQETSVVLASTNRTAILSSGIDTQPIEAALPNEFGPGVWMLIAIGIAISAYLAITGIRRLRAMA